MITTGNQSESRTAQTPTVRQQKMLRSLFLLCVVGGFLACAGGSQGSIDYRLLFGTWSESGSCSSSLRIFTPEGRYLWLQGEDDKWEVNYLGVFVTDSVATRTLGVPGAVFIAEQLASDAGSALLAITELNRNRLVFELYETDREEPSSETFLWVRCQPTELGQDRPE